MRPVWARAELARRNPTLLFRLDGVFLLRLATRVLRGLLFQEPPRLTRLEAVLADAAWAIARPVPSAKHRGAPPVFRSLRSAWRTYRPAARGAQ